MSLIINKIFSGVAKVLENLTIKKLSKTDPELANEFRELQKTKKEVDNYLSVEGKKQ